MAIKRVKVTRQAKKIAARHIERSKSRVVVDGDEYPAEHITVDATNIVVAVMNEPKVDPTVPGHVRVLNTSPIIDRDVYFAALLAYYRVGALVVSGLDKSNPTAEIEVVSEVTVRPQCNWKQIGKTAASTAMISAVSIGAFVVAQKFMDR